MRPCGPSQGGVTVLSSAEEMLQNTGQRLKGDNPLTGLPSGRLLTRLGNFILLQNTAVQRLKGDNPTTGLPSRRPVTRLGNFILLSGLDVKTTERQAWRWIVARKRLIRDIHVTRNLRKSELTLPHLYITPHRLCVRFYRVIVRVLMLPISFFLYGTQK